ncbi:hypothetical protein AQUCO_03000017v1, partial [Aquilegia coerulea]
LQCLVLSIESYKTLVHLLLNRLALLAFRSQITLDPMMIMSSWNDSHHFCQWEGVTCSLRHSRVTMLNLDSRGLVGSISPHIGNLSLLSVLNLQNNSFHGVIPQEIGGLFRLEGLSLVNNSLVGEIPINISLCSSLTRLFLSGNNFVGKIPMELGSLPKLVRLALENDKITGEIPPSLGNITTLEGLYLSYNNLEGNLTYLALQGNNLGSGKSEDLNFLTPLANCTNLDTLMLNSNQFGGMLPPSVGNFSNQLTKLYLYENRISGNIPTELQNLQSLIVLDLSTNFFTGSIPMGLGNLRMLQILSLEYNQLSGHVPYFLGNMSQLVELYLFNNFLDGNIFSTLENQILQILDLSRNNFTGTIPREIGLSSHLNQLILGHNSLTGSIPLEVGNLKNLEYLDVSENRMSGEIPSALGSLRLEYLYLQSNSFQGPLPSSLTLLEGLLSLDVSRNNLSGGVPKQFEKLSGLTNLNLSFNNFEGDVPIGGVFRNSSAISLFGNVKVCGGIPSLRLPKCHFETSKKQGIGLALKVILGVLISLFMVGLLLAFFYFRKNPKTKPPPEECLGDLKRVLNLIERGASKTFMAECEALREVRHRNLLKILTVCSSADFKGNDFKALVFEFMPNGSLEHWLHPNEDVEDVPRNLNLCQRLNIAIDVATALDYLHNYCERPIAHCDLKPSNILLSDDLTAHVGDFGLAKFLSETKSTITSSKDESRSIAIRGTIGYIPPEYGAVGGVSTQGDIYSYGICLLEMFTGKKPTHQMFKDGVSLHDYTKLALPHRVMEIIDVHLLADDTHSGNIDLVNRGRECLSLIIRIGVACSVPLMNERMNIKDVLKDLHSIKAKYLQV